MKISVKQIYFLFSILIISEVSCKSVDLSSLSPKKLPNNFIGNLTILDNSVNETQQLLCKVLRTFPPDDGLKVIVTTDDEEANHHYTVPTGQKCLSFQIRAAKDAILYLDDYIWINIGAEENMISFMKRRNPDTVLAHSNTENILDQINFKSFWITWSDQIIQVGREEEDSPFLSYEFSSELIFDLINLKTLNGSTGVWIFGKSQPKCPGRPNTPGQLSEIKCSKIYPQ